MKYKSQRERIFDMDNQNFNHDNFNDDSFHSDNTNQQINRYEQPDFTFYNGSTYQRNGETQSGTQKENQDGFQGYQNQYQTYYQNTQYQNYTPYEGEKKQKTKRKRRERKTGGFGTKRSIVLRQRNAST